MVQAQVDLNDEIYQRQREIKDELNALEDLASIRAFDITILVSMHHADLLPLVTDRKASDFIIRGFFEMHVHSACILLSFSGQLTVWSVSVSNCFYSLCQVVVLSKVVELAGVEPVIGIHIVY